MPVRCDTRSSSVTEVTSHNHSPPRPSRRASSRSRSLKLWLSLRRFGTAFNSMNSASISPSICGVRGRLRAVRFVGLAQDPGGRPGPVRRGSKFRPSFCKVLTTKPRAANPSLIAGCALIPVGVRTISPSSAIRSDRASARSTAWQHWVSISTPAASSIAYPSSLDAKAPDRARRAAARVEARLSRVQQGLGVEGGQTFSFAKIYSRKNSITRK